MTESKRTTLPEEFIKKLDEIAKSYGFETSVKNEEKKEEESSEEEKENKKKGSYIEDYIFSNYKIRDLESHFSEITEIKDYDVVTIVITNSHDKQIAFRIYMSPIPSRIKGVKAGEERTVYPGETEAYTITTTTAGWLPYLYLEAFATEIPTRGELNVSVYKLIKKVEI